VSNDAPQRTLEFKTLEEFQPQTGDLLFVSYTDIRSVFIRSFTGSMWMHPAFILRDKDSKLWILEGSSYPKISENTRSYDGFFFIPFEDWYRINRKHTIAYFYHRGPKIDIGSIAAFERKHHNVEIEGLDLAWIRFLSKRPYVQNDHAVPKGSYTCIELIIRLLQHCGILSKLHHCSSYMPYELYHRQIPYDNGHSYDEPVELRIKTKLG
jgi:hypothetical protein